MSYQFQADRLYRMPTHFGPSLGPRQGPDGRRFACKEGPRDFTVQATFKADPEQLEKLMPPGFTLREPYTLCFTFGYSTECEWFAGRGYNLFGITTPVTYQGKEETVEGDLQLVLWENKADPIITGREDLGYCKLYCEIPEVQILGDKVICRASWDGCEFAKLTLSGVTEIALDEFPAGHDSEGTLNYKYIPKTCIPGEADIEYAVLVPDTYPNVVFEGAEVAANAECHIRHSTWEELPTLVHIVNTLADLTLGDCVSAVLIRTHGGKDLSDSRILR